jgi:hypothetical protein
MAYRKATPQETKDWLGSGLVTPGRKPPSSSEPSSMESSSQESYDKDRPETEQDAQLVQDQRRFLALQSLQQSDLDQAEHDERMAKLTQEERRAMIKGLGDLARSKIR